MDEVVDAISMESIMADRIVADGAIRANSGAFLFGI
jgi:hypothetical protein